MTLQIQESDDSENVYKDGTYTGSAQGFGGAITVQVTLANDEITDIQVTSAPGEDSAYLSQGEGVISSIISAQSTDVDTVSGATFSSTGIINAVVDALGKAEN
ncbi:MAG: FMN-binding protein [Blautia obeum]